MKTVKALPRICTVPRCARASLPRRPYCPGHAGRQDLLGSPTARRCRCCQRAVEIEEDDDAATLEPASAGRCPWVCLRCGLAGCRLLWPAEQPQRGIEWRRWKAARRQGCRLILQVATVATGGAGARLLDARSLAVRGARPSSFAVLGGTT